MKLVKSSSYISERVRIFFLQVLCLKIASMLKIKALTGFLSYVDQSFAVLKNKFSEAMSICQEHFLFEGENDSFWARLSVI